MTPPILAYVHLLSYPLPVIAGVAKYARLHKAMKAMTILTALACLSIGTEFVLASYKMRNYIVSDYFRVIEVGMLCLVFQMSVADARTRIILRSLGGVFVSIWAADMVLHNAAQIDNVMELISRIFVLVMSLITLQLAMKDESSPLVQRSIFWVALGAAVYSSGTLMLLGLSNYLLQLGTSHFLAAWHVNWTFLIVANLLYMKGILCNPQG
jgi:hypothetical protein